MREQKEWDKRQKSGAVKDEKTGQLKPASTRGKRKRAADEDDDD